MRKYLKGLCNKHIIVSNLILGLVGVVVIPFAMPLPNAAEAAIYFITRMFVMSIYMRFVMGVEYGDATKQSLWFTVIILGVGFATVEFVNHITNNIFLATSIYTLLRIISYPIWAGRYFK